MGRILGPAAITIVCAGWAATVAAICNTAPSAIADTTAASNEFIVIDPLANDSDPEGHALTVSIETSTCTGEVSVDEFGLVSFQPSQVLTAPCQIGYQVRDELGLTASANILVDPAPPAPVIFRDDFERGDATAWSTCTPSC